MGFLEQYFNQCMRQVREALAATYTHYESFDWREVLEQASYLVPGQPQLMADPLPVASGQEQSVDHNELLNRKLRFQLTLVDLLTLNIAHRYSQLTAHSLQSDHSFLLAQALEEYLSRLEVSSQPPPEDIVDVVSEHQDSL